jgi:hypothetical protein
MPAFEWHVAKDGKSEGPFDAGTLGRLIVGGEITRETLVWKAGMAGWQPVGTIAELNSLFAAVPPPVPVAAASGEASAEGEGNARAGRARR